MIEVIIKRSMSRDIISFQIRGHAKYAAHGEDIVCAGVSALAQTTVISMSQLLKIKGKTMVEEGNLQYEIPDSLAAAQKEKAALLLENMVLGIKEINKNYPGYIKIKELKINQN